MEAVWGCVFNDDLGGLHRGGDIRWRPFLDGLLIEDIRTQVGGEGCTGGFQMSRPVLRVTVSFATY